MYFFYHVSSQKYGISLFALYYFQYLQLRLPSFYLCQLIFHVTLTMSVADIQLVSKHQYPSINWHVYDSSPSEGISSPQPVGYTDTALKRHNYNTTSAHSYETTYNLITCLRFCCFWYLLLPPAYTIIFIISFSTS